MSTGFMVHSIRSIRAEAGLTSGAPLRLLARDEDGHRFEVVLFTDDMGLNDRLVAAINDAVAAHEAEKAAAHEAERVAAQEAA